MFYVSTFYTMQTIYRIFIFCIYADIDKLGNSKIIKACTVRNECSKNFNDLNLYGVCSGKWSDNVLYYNYTNRRLKPIMSGKR